MPPTTGDLLTQYGLPGIVIIALLGALKILWNKYNEHVDGRLEDYKLLIKLTEQNVEVIKGLKEALNKKEE